MPTNLINKVKRAIGAGWERIVSRLGLWVNHAIGAFNRGVIDREPIPGEAEPRFMWQLGATERHCRDCSTLNGQIKTSAEWAAAGIQPQSPDLECGGWYCDCRLVPVTGDVQE